MCQDIKESTHPGVGVCAPQMSAVALVSRIAQIACWLALLVAPACKSRALASGYAGSVASADSRFVGDSVRQKRPSSRSGLAFVPPAAAPEYRAKCPPDMVRIADFCIDRYEARLVQLEDDGRIVPHPHYDRPEPGKRYLALSEAGVFPQGYVSRLESASACENAGKRLCKLTEWYRSCTGARGWTYPYGKTEQPNVCNTKKVHLLTHFFGGDPHGWAYDAHFNSPLLDQQPGFLAETGAYVGCASEEGVYDLVGNLHEWVSNAIDRELADQVPFIGNVHNKLGKLPENGIFMGGFFSTGSEHGEGCTYLTIGHEPKYHDYSTGFRCCRDADLRNGPVLRWREL
jgi:sulfatase modifying factor 1